MHAFKPVVLIHGIMTGSESMELIRNRIEEVCILKHFRLRCHLRGYRSNKSSIVTSVKLNFLKKPFIKK